MQEIKFRAWHKGRMFYSDSQEDAELLGAKLGDSCVAIFFTNFYGKDLMQYTGLKDKNEREIYEGDIVDDNWFNVHKEKINQYHIVKFGEHEANGGDYYSNTAYGFFLENDKGETYTLLYHEPIEVIGNIYQTPDLVKAK